MIAALAVIAIAGCGGTSTTTAASKPPPPAPATSTANIPLTTTAQPPKPKPKPRPKPRPKPKPDPGALPQTEQLPSASTRAFHAEMASLWAGVRRDSVTAALPAFFPRRAYIQVKRVADPEADYDERLLIDYRLDLAAAHELLGGTGAGARLVDVQVPKSYAHWVEPGACYNGVGYYEVPNARIIYRQHGVVRSFGIASMISWRGVWYVIHLGAVDRPSAVGLVDDPTTGTGESVPSSTC